MIYKVFGCLVIQKIKCDFFGIFSPFWLGKKVFRVFCYWPVIKRGRARFTSFDAIGVKEYTQHVLMSLLFPSAHKGLFLKLGQKEEL
jgi:hypothetical protein